MLTAGDRQCYTLNTITITKQSGAMKIILQWANYSKQSGLLGDS